MNQTLIDIVTVIILFNGSVHEEATILNTFDMIYEQVEYEFNWWLKLPRDFESSRKGDCSDASYLAQNKLARYNITTIRRGGTAECGGNIVYHSWLEYNSKAFDVRQWGRCKNFKVNGYIQ